MSSLPDDLDALSAGAPPVADWPGLVRATVRARRRRRSLVSAAAALSLVAVSGIGVVYAAGDGREPSTLVAATPGPSPSPTVSSACGGALVAPTLPVPESDGDEVNDVTVAVAVSCTTVRVGEPVRLLATAVGDLAPPMLFPTIGGRYLGSIASCPGGPRPTDFPDSPGQDTGSYDHVYGMSGFDTITVEAKVLCGSPPGSASESIRITILPALNPVTATPTASSTRATEPTATPDATPTTAPPEPTYPPARNVVSIDITVSPARPRVGEEITVTVVARGDKGGVRFALISFAGGKKGFQGTDFSCPPGEPVPPKPVEVRETFTHVYEEPGDDAILIEVDSGCGYYQGSGTKRGVITVDPAEGATPSPTP